VWPTILIAMALIIAAFCVSSAVIMQAAWKD
jgi:hypothetical protein